MTNESTKWVVQSKKVRRGRKGGGYEWMCSAGPFTDRAKADRVAVQLAAQFRLPTRVVAL